MLRNFVAGLSMVLTAVAVSAQGIRDVTVAEKAQSAKLSRKISVSFDNTPIAEALWAVAQRAGTNITFDRTVLPAKNITYKADNLEPEVAFNKILSGTGFKAARVSDGSFELVKTGLTAASKGQGVISGKVTDAKNGKGIAGANVSIGNDTRGVVSGEDGSYRLAGVGAGPHTVTVRILGYAKQTRFVTIGDGATTIADFKLEPSANVLDQVVVTGTIVQTELKAVPNAITVITAKQIEDRGITKIDQLFRGDVPGIFAQNQGSSPSALLDEVMMFSRGATALTEYSSGLTKDPNGGVFLTTPIKTYIDGVELADPKYLSQIDPKSIDRIEILTGPQASTVYGSNAINGVMQIFTKRGTTSRPQVSLNLLSGWVENNFSSSYTPQHDYTAQLNGIEGDLSYNAGGSWNYTGPWTPAKQLTRVGGFGGGRLDLSTPLGRLTGDVTFRRSTTQTRQRGSMEQKRTGYYENGWYFGINSPGRDVPQTRTLASQTLGLTLGYAPTNWWSHELGTGQDASDTELRFTGRGYTAVSDTTLRFEHSHMDRRSLRYSTTAHVPITSVTHATVTAGADVWQTLTSMTIVRPQVLSGSLVDQFGTPSISRRPDHNTGGFLQGQLGIKDQLFLTYGLRAEWNPGFGAAAQPNYAPRYGVAYTHELGYITAKLRGSYGRSTRPPQPKFREAVPAVQAFGSGWPVFSPYYAPFDLNFANPDLIPEYQRGAEGGLELYAGNRGSLVVTRFDQTVDGLIGFTSVDSVRTLTPCAASFACDFYSRDSDGYGYWYQFQYLNLGSIRNQGWELQGSGSVGPITTRGTYSWTKSRTIGINPKYSALLKDEPQYRPGATFKYLPEHTWALGITYAHAASSIGLNMMGVGRVTVSLDDRFVESLDPRIRLQQNRASLNTSGYSSIANGYVLADLAASHRFTSRIEGVLNVQNIGDYYRNDYRAQYATIGRQIKSGMRVKF